MIASAITSMRFCRSWMRVAEDRARWRTVGEALLVLLLRYSAVVYTQQHARLVLAVKYSRTNLGFLKGNQS
jgi:hypothetical protein